MKINENKDLLNRVGLFILRKGNYLWTRYVWTYTDGTAETGYSVAKMGDTGPKGDTW